MLLVTYRTVYQRVWLLAVFKGISQTWQDSWKVSRIIWPTDPLFVSLTTVFKYPFQKCCPKCIFIPREIIRNGNAVGDIPYRLSTWSLLPVFKGISQTWQDSWKVSRIIWPTDPLFVSLTSVFKYPFQKCRPKMYCQPQRPKSIYCEWV